MQEMISKTALHATTTFPLCQEVTTLQMLSVGQLMNVRQASSSGALKGQTSSSGAVKGQTSSSGALKGQTSSSGAVKGQTSSLGALKGPTTRQMPSVGHPTNAHVVFVACRNPSFQKNCPIFFTG